MCRKITEKELTEYFMNKFEVGDIVKIKEDADKIKPILFAYVESMSEYLGTERKVVKIRNDDFLDYYYLDGCLSKTGSYWAFEEQWLEPGRSIDITESDFNLIMEDL